MALYFVGAGRTSESNQRRTQPQVYRCVWWWAVSPPFSMSLWTFTQSLLHLISLSVYFSLHPSFSLSQIEKGFRVTLPSLSLFVLAPLNSLDAHPFSLSLSPSLCLSVSLSLSFPTLLVFKILWFGSLQTLMSSRGKIRAGITSKHQHRLPSSFQIPPSSCSFFSPPFIWLHFFSLCLAFPLLDLPSSLTHRSSFSSNFPSVSHRWHAVLFPSAQTRLGGTPFILHFASSLSFQLSFCHKVFLLNICFPFNCQVLYWHKHKPTFSLLITLERPESSYCPWVAFNTLCLCLCAVSLPVTVCLSNCPCIFGLKAENLNYKIGYFKLN